MGADPGRAFLRQTSRDIVRRAKGWVICRVTLRVGDCRGFDFHAENLELGGFSHRASNRRTGQEYSPRFDITRRQKNHIGPTRRGLHGPSARIDPPLLFRQTDIRPRLHPQLAQRRRGASEQFASAPTRPSHIGTAVSLNPRVCQCLQLAAPVPSGSIG